MHSRIIFHAARVKGGAAPLARALGVPLTDVQAWMHAATPLPDRYLGRLLDIIAEETLRSLDERGRNMGEPGSAGSN